MSRKKATPETITDLFDPFTLYLRAKGLSENTVKVYRHALTKFLYFMEQENEPWVKDITPDDVQAFMVHIRRRNSPATASQYFRSLQAFFKWAVTDTVLQDNPMDGLSAPRVPEKRVPVLSATDLNNIVRACEGNLFTDIRDKAIITLFIETGCRLSEVANLNVEDVHLDGRDNTIDVVGKGDRPRTVPIGSRSAGALSRYMRQRDRGRYADTPWLWIGQHGRLTASGIEQAVAARTKKAGLGRIGVHRFRHTFADMALSGGMQEGDLMTVAGWKTRAMLDRYGASRRQERAVQAYRRMRSPLDR